MLAHGRDAGARDAAVVVVLVAAAAGARQATERGHKGATTKKREGRWL